MDTIVCLTLAKWETVSGHFRGYLNTRDNARFGATMLKQFFEGCSITGVWGAARIIETLG